MRNSSMIFRGVFLAALFAGAAVAQPTGTQLSGPNILFSPTIINTETLISTDPGATAGPIFDIYRNSASPAANDILGQIQYNGKDSGNAKQLYGNESMYSRVVTAAGEIGLKRWGMTYNGSAREIFGLDGETGVQIGRGGDSLGYMRFIAGVLGGSDVARIVSNGNSVRWNMQNTGGTSWESDYTTNDFSSGGPRDAEALRSIYDSGANGWTSVFPRNSSRNSTIGVFGAATNQDFVIGVKGTGNIFLVHALAADGGSNTQIAQFAGVASAVQAFTFTNATTGSAVGPIISFRGETDTSGRINLAGGGQLTIASLGNKSDPLRVKNTGGVTTGVQFENSNNANGFIEYSTTDLNIYANNALQAKVVGTASATSWVEFRGSTSGNPAIVGNSATNSNLSINSAGNGSIIFTAGSAGEGLRINQTAVVVKSGFNFQLGNAYVAGVTVPTGSIVIYDSAGVAYKVSACTAC